MTDLIAMLPVKCPLCGADDYRVRYPSRRARGLGGDKSKISMEYFRCTSHHLAEHGDIVKCNRCGMVYTNPQPDPGKLLNIYREVEDPLYLEETTARDHTFKRSLEQMHRFARPPGKLLDVGCYTGAFMETAKNAGWDVSGAELSNWAAEIAGQTGTGPVYQVPLNQLPVSPGSFDAVTFWDVMEHLSQPAAFLQDAARLLKPGGIIGFSTHMVDSGAVRLLGTRYPFFMDMHLVHFSRTTITRILEEQGYELLRIAPHHRILRSGYFLEKLAVKMPAGGSFVRKLSKKKWVSQRFIRIGFLGLVNIFAGVR
ncbi:MAG: class I SAM-dependent methyltransferase [bacterium]|nr:class I SAM-dependent methyltransferase [bacterium]